MGANLRERVADRANSTEVAVATGPSLLDMIRQNEEQFALAMPRGAEASQLIRDAITCTRHTPDLLNCVPKTVLGGLMTCAQLGLRPGVLGHAWLLPFKEHGILKAQFVIGYQGLVELAFRSGQISSISGQTVYEADTFDFYRDEHGDHMMHRPELKEDPGAPLMYYAHAIIRGGGYAITKPLNHAGMTRFRDKYVKAKRGPWFDPEQFESMAWKTMLKRLAKLLPKSTELATALAADETVRVDLTPDAITEGEHPEVIDSELEETTPTSSPPANEGWPPVNQPPS